MSTNTSKPTVPAKLPRTKKPAASKKQTSTTKSRKQAVPSSKTRRPRVSASSPSPTPLPPEAVHSDTSTRPSKYFLGRDGVAFGPFSAFQLRESVRLGIFEGNDLALVEDGKQWLEISRLLPLDAPFHDDQPGSAPTLSPTTEERLEWQEVAEVLPAINTSLAPRSEQRRATPLSEHHLREHEANFADVPTSPFLTDLIHGRFTWAVVPVAAVVLGLVIMAAAFKQRESSRSIRSQPASPQKQPAVQTITRSDLPFLKVLSQVDNPSAGSPWYPGSTLVETMPPAAMAGTSH